MKLGIISAVVMVVGCSSSPPQPSSVSTGSSSAPSAPPATQGAVSVADAWKLLCDGPSAFPIDVHDSRDWVTVGIKGPKGSENVALHVDTGGNTPGILLHKEVADRLGFGEKDPPKTLSFAGRDVAVPEGARFVLLDQEEQKRMRSFRKSEDAGQLGAGFLSRFVVCIDVEKKRMALGDPKELRIAPNEKNAVPMVLQPGGANHALYPFVQVAFATASEPVAAYGMLLDTGATTSMLEVDKMDHLKRKVPAWPLSKGGAAGDADMIGGMFAESMLRAEKVIFTVPAEPGKQRPVEIVTAANGLFVSRPAKTWEGMFGEVDLPHGAHGAIANDVLHRFKLLIDYPGSRLFMEPIAHATPASASMKRIGIAISFGDDGCPVIRQVNDDNNKDVLSWIKAGDVLLSVDGKDTCKMSHEEISAALAGEVGDQKTLKLKRAGAPIESKVTVADLLAK